MGKQIHVLKENCSNYECVVSLQNDPIVFLEQTFTIQPKQPLKIGYFQFSSICCLMETRQFVMEVYILAPQFAHDLLQILYVLIEFPLRLLPQFYSLYIKILLESVFIKHYLNPKY